jgi:arsenate reductase
MRVLFLCTHNSARSQMAEGLLRHLGGGRFDVFSAGTTATRVRPEAVEAMRELGIDISGHVSKDLGPFVAQAFDLVITVCDDANESCPVFPNARRRWHWSIEDPSKVEAGEAERREAFRRARDELKRRIEEQVLELVSP